MRWDEMRWNGFILFHHHHHHHRHFLGSNWKIQKFEIFCGCWLDLISYITDVCVRVLQPHSILMMINELTYYCCRFCNLGETNCRFLHIHFLCFSRSLSLPLSFIVVNAVVRPFVYLQCCSVGFHFFDKCSVEIFSICYTRCIWGYCGTCITPELWFSVSVCVYVKLLLLSSMQSTKTINISIKLHILQQKNDATNIWTRNKMISNKWSRMSYPNLNFIRANRTCKT